MWFQLGLHQMRANKDEGKPEGHTLMKFAYPYFRDTGLVVSYNSYYSLNGKLCVKKEKQNIFSSRYVVVQFFPLVKFFLNWYKIF